MDISRDFSKLTHAQLLHFAKAGFNTYWELDTGSSYLKPKGMTSGTRKLSIHKIGEV